MNVSRFHTKRLRNYEAANGQSFAVFMSIFAPVLYVHALLEKWFLCEKKRLARYDLLSETVTVKIGALIFEEFFGTNIKTNTPVI